MTITYTVIETHIYYSLAFRIQLLTLCQKTSRIAVIAFLPKSKSSAVNPYSDWRILLIIEGSFWYNDIQKQTVFSFKRVGKWDQGGIAVAWVLDLSTL